MIELEFPNVGRSVPVRFGDWDATFTYLGRTPTPFTLVLTGLDGNIARIGSEAGIELVSNVTLDEVIWSLDNPEGNDKSSANGTFGFGENPTSLVLGNTQTLFAHARKGAAWLTRSAQIRYPVPLVVSPLAIEIVNDLPPDTLAGFAEVITVESAAVWTAPGAVFNRRYQRRNPTTGLWADIPGSAAVNYAITAADSGARIRRAETAEASGQVVTEVSNEIDVEVFAAPVIGGKPTITLVNGAFGFEVGRPGIMVAAPVTGNPPPVTTLQLLIDGEPVPGIVGTGTAVPFEIPNEVGGVPSVLQTTTNALGQDVQSGDPYDPITGGLVAVFSNLSVGTQTADGLPIFYTTNIATPVKIFAMPAGNLVLTPTPPAGIADEVVAETVAGALGYIDATFTTLDSNALLGVFPAGIFEDADLFVLPEGGDDSNVYLIGTVSPLNTLEAPIITPITGGLNFAAPLMNPPVITPIQGGLNFGE